MQSKQIVASRQCNGHSQSTENEAINAFDSKRPSTFGMVISPLTVAAPEKFQDFHDNINTPQPICCLRQNKINEGNLFFLSEKELEGVSNCPLHSLNLSNIFKMLEFASVFKENIKIVIENHNGSGYRTHCVKNFEKMYDRIIDLSDEGTPFFDTDLLIANDNKIKKKLIENRVTSNGIRRLQWFLIGC
jgi:hypothetical protein